MLDVSFTAYQSKLHPLILEDKISSTELVAAKGIDVEMICFHQLLLTSWIPTKPNSVTSLKNICGSDGEWEYSFSCIGKLKAGTFLGYI